MIDEYQNEPVYTTLRSIEERKMQLLKEIRKDSDKINKLRRQLFTKPEPIKGKNGFLMKNVINTGAGVFDGLLLAWKLYRKFRK